MTNRQRTPIEGIVRATNTAQADAFLAWLRRMAVATDADSGNITFTLGEKEGETTFRVDDSAHVAQLTLDSDGNLAVKTIAAPEAVWELGEFVEADALDGWTLKGNVVTVTAAYTMLATDYTILADATAGSFEILLADAEAVPGQLFNIKRIDDSANEVTLTTTKGQAIDDYASGALGLTENESFAVQSDGLTWRIT
jgi:hypothetical protein